jgi:hypothetical protein
VAIGLPAFGPTAIARQRQQTATQVISYSARNMVQVDAKFLRHCEALQLDKNS